ncbi:unnamed protein product [Rhodiola kirilowii]
MVESYGLGEAMNTVNLELVILSQRHNLFLSTGYLVLLWLI